MFLKAFFGALSTVVAIPTILILSPFWLGIEIKEEIVKSGISILENSGPAIFSILLIIVAIETSYRIIKNERKRYDDNFYQVNTQARLEQAHYVFFHLYLEGKKASSGVPDHRHKWDKEVLSAIRIYGNENCLSIYLTNTGRIDPGTDFKPLPDDKFDYAQSFVWNLLEKDFEHFFKI